MNLRQVSARLGARAGVSGVREWSLTLPISSGRRVSLMRRFGATVGRGVRVHRIEVMNPGWRNLTIEDDCYLGVGVVLDLKDSLTVGRGSVLAVGSMVLTHQDAGATHGSAAASRIGTWSAPTELGAECFLGAGAVVLAGRRLGREVVVGSGSVVTKDVSDGLTVAGVPARVLGGASE